MIPITKYSIHIFFSIAILFIGFGKNYGQNISVIGIEGEVFVKKDINGKGQYHKLVYGPLKDVHAIIVKEKSKVTLANNDKSICKLESTGEFKVSELVFQDASNFNMFNKFCKYFTSFFTNHESSESKANYKNSIYAISRGTMAEPFLDFPLDGLLPYGRLGAMPFQWTHDCDGCQYLIEVRDLDTKEPVYTNTTSEKHITMENSEILLKPGKKYYWAIEVVGQDVKSESSIFTMSTTADFESIISVLKNDIQNLGKDSDELSQNIYIISSLEETDLPNYAILYGFYLKEKSKDNPFVSDIVDRLLYDHLMEK